MRIKRGSTARQHLIANRTYLNANTFSYLCTNFTAGIWVCTTSQPRTATRRSNENQSHEKTVRLPKTQVNVRSETQKPCRFKSSSPGCS